MTWSELLFAHWRVEPDLVRKHLPKGLELDTHQGSAWVGVVPFLMSDVAPRGCPAMPVLSKFLELNVRTYVTKDGKPGVWFFSLDAASPIAVRAARATFNLPYMNARMSLKQQRESSAIHYASLRTHRDEPAAQFNGSYQPVGERFQAQPATLEHWLTARYCLYSANKKGELFRGEINHRPWTLRNAEHEIQQNTMGDPYGFDFTAIPSLLYADVIRVQAWWPTRC
ncbi:MAG: hypothetical protein CMM01_23985 [Rhodopirellula sp.]|nr:hypothetical protein [Rhodopirellula sp.]